MTRVVGHRGAAGHAPENTLASFERAVEIGADVVELDVRTSADGVPVVIHDGTVDELTDGSGAVNDLTLEELQDLTVEGSGKIPTLDELLDFLADTDVDVRVEPKEFGLADTVIAAIEEYGLEDRTSVVSFEPEAIREFVDAGVPDAVTLSLTTGDPFDEAFLNAGKELDCSWLSMSMSSATQELVEEAQERGFEVGLFTANDPDEIEEVLSLGSDYVCSDYPDRVLERI
jgi:glycerophosphoryl diester phosphodiesterase